MSRAQIRAGATARAIEKTAERAVALQAAAVASEGHLVVAAPYSEADRKPNSAIAKTCRVKEGRGDPGFRNFAGEAHQPRSAGKQSKGREDGAESDQPLTTQRAVVAHEVGKGHLFA
jgi:hypothetical protein